MNEITHYKDETEKTNLKTIFDSFLNNENLLPIFLLGLLIKSGHLNGNTDEIASTAEMLRMSKPYFKSTHKDALSKTENILDALYSLNKLAKGEYKMDDSYMKSYNDVKDKPVKILQAVRPHIKGKSRETIDRVLTVEDRVKRLKNKDRQKNILEDFDNMTDILEMIQGNKGKEVRNVITKAKQMIEIMKH